MFTIIAFVATLSLLRAIYGCAPNCTCEIKIGGMNTVDCNKKGMDIFPAGIDNDTQLLRIDGNRIDAIPYNLSQLVPELRVIDMSDNKVTHLPSRIFAGLKNLKAVILNNNHLTTIGGHIFADNESPNLVLKFPGNQLEEINENAFRGLRADTKLDLRKNRLKKLHPDTFNGVHLEKLEMSYNQIVSLPDGLFRNQKNLHYIELNGNNISSLSNNTFKGLSSLLHLDLSSNKIKELPADVFKTNRILKTLDLSSNQLTELPDDLFQANPKLKKISLGKNLFRYPPTNLPNGIVISLKRNPIVCDCELKVLLSNSSYKSRLNDIDNVLCDNSTNTTRDYLLALNCDTTTPPPTTTVNTTAETNSTRWLSSTEFTTNSTSLNTSTIAPTIRPGNKIAMIVIPCVVAMVLLVAIGTFCFIQRHSIGRKLCHKWRSYNVHRRSFANVQGGSIKVNDEFEWQLTMPRGSNVNHFSRLEEEY